MIRPRKKDPHLPRCVYLRHGAYWRVQKGKWTRLGTELAESLAEYGRRISEPSGGMAALIDQVLVEHAKKIAANSLKQYQVTARMAKRAFAEFRPDQVRGKHIAALKRELGDTPTMANRVMSFLRIVFTYAVEWQVVDSNPCIGVPPYAERKRDRYITDAEYAAIYAQAGPRLQVIMDLCYLTGQRIGDVLGIRRADISEPGVAFRQQKTGARLLVAASPDLSAVIERARGLRGNVLAATLLQGAHGKAPDYHTIQKQWLKACAAAGVEDAHLHDLRAKSLTDAKRQGLDPTALAGHADAKMTERYIRARQVPTVTGPSFGQSKTSVGQTGKK